MHYITEGRSYSSGLCGRYAEINTFDGSGMATMKETIKFIETPDHWIITVQGLEVTRICIDYAFAVEVAPPDDYLHIRVEGAALFKMKGHEYNLTPEQHPEDLMPLLSVLHKEMTSAIAYNNGSLKLEFSNECSLFVPARDKYEAWEIAKKYGTVFVSRPGGGLAVWPPK